MIRKIIKIDPEKCNGCGLCVSACHEGAIGLVDGKAQLLREDYCDGLGDCLPACPTNAISFETREAAEYDEKAVQENMNKKARPAVPCACPGSQAKVFEKDAEATNSQEATKETDRPSQLKQWPVQIKLVNPCAPYLDNAHILIAADCCAYAHGNFHDKYMKNKITLIGCPKLDEGDYADKLTEILNNNEIKSITVARMEVPCCGGIVNAVKEALKNSGKQIPWQIVNIATNGKIVEQ